MNIYVVMGTTGEYSDRDEWPICAYTDEEQAKLHVDRASEAARIERLRREQAKQLYYYSTRQPGSPYDPDMQMDYAGTSYYYMTVPQVETVDTFVALHTVVT